MNESGKRQVVFDIIEPSFYHKSMKLLINWIISALVILSAAYLLPGIHVAGVTTALAVALVLGVFNAILRPILVLLTLPINILTLGLFTLAINAFLVMIVAVIVPGFIVDSFWWALIFGVSLSIINGFLHRLS